MVKEGEKPQAYTRTMGTLALPLNKPVKTIKPEIGETIKIERMGRAVIPIRVEQNIKSKGRKPQGR
jgi:hypothetical protein